VVTKRQEAAGRPARLDRNAWIDAATDMLVEHGLAAVAVEPLAKRLGATKGSFYWHFTDRNELVRAVLEAWAQRHTEAVIAAVEREPDPRRRLGELFTRVIADRPDMTLEMRLLANTADPLVAQTLRSVVERRVTYVTECFEALDMPPTQARQRARLAYSAYAGLAQTQHVTAGSFLPDAERAGYLTLLRSVLESPAADR
jgi:AcrR family transcriptional regulator